MAQYMPPPNLRQEYEPYDQGYAYDQPQQYGHRPQPHSRQDGKRKNAGGGLFSQYKDVIIIALAVFALLFWVQPKLRTMLPQLFGSTGGLNVAGMVSLGVVAGLLYRFGAEYLPG